MEWLSSIIGGIGSLIGADMNRNTQENIAERNINQQREFAQSGIRWRVNDAREAGIHPLYALGANTTSFSPVSVGSSDFSGALGQMGQGVGRAVNAAATAPERALQTVSNELSVERQRLENDVLRARLASQLKLEGSPQVGPAFQVSPGVPGKQGDFEALTGKDFSQTRMGGKDFTPSSFWSDAQTIENRVGEMSDLAGPWILDSDIRANSRGRRSLLSEALRKADEAADEWNTGRAQRQIINAVIRRLRRQGFLFDPIAE